MMNANIDGLLSTFRNIFERLNEHPDKFIITDLTKFAEDHIDIAYNVATVVVGRLISPTTPAPYKLPILYLIDSIMKNVGGPFAAFFSKQLAEVYTVAFSGLHEKDKGRLVFLLDTWRDRNLLPHDLLLKMKYQLSLSVSFLFLWWIFVQTI